MVNIFRYGQCSNYNLCAIYGFIFVRLIHSNRSYGKGKQ